MDASLTRLTLDPGNTRVTFCVRWFGVWPVRGRFEAVRGGVLVPGTGHGGFPISVEVDSASVRTGIPLRDRHLRGPRFLGAAEYPVIRFEGEASEAGDGVWAVRGRLVLRGLAREVVVNVPDESADAMRHFTARFAVPRRPHAIGAARGIRRLNPLLWAIGADVLLRVEVIVPATLLQTSAVPARAR